MSSINDAETRPKQETSEPVAAPPSEAIGDMLIEAPSPARPKRQWLGRLLTILIVLVAAFAGAAIARYVWPGLGSPSSNSAALERQVLDLQSRLDAADIDRLKARLAALEGAASPGGSNDLSQLTERLALAEQATAALSATVTGLQQQPAAVAPGAAQPLPPNSLAALNVAVTALRNQIADVSAHLEASETGLKTASAALSDRIASVEQKEIPANLPEQLLNLSSKTDLLALDQRIGALEANTAALDAKRAAAAIALTNLARAASSGAPFARELEAVQYLEIDRSLLAPITGFADKGVRPASDLIAAYDRDALEALRASRMSNKNWWGRFWANVADKFFIRRVGKMEGNSAEAVLSRAGDAVHAGNLKVAVAEVSSLKGAAGKAMAKWRAEATARVELDQLIASLTTNLIATLNNQAHP